MTQALRRIEQLLPMKAVLAVRNLQRSGGRIWVALCGIVFATFLMAVQGSLLYGFSKAASRIVDAVDADILVVAKGTPAFEFVSVVPERYAFVARGVAGVRDAGRGVAGWVPLERPNGDRTVIMLVGVDHGFAGRIPAVSALAAARGIGHAALVSDVTDAPTLGLDGRVRHVQVAARRGYFVDRSTGFSSFLGTPLTFSGYVDAHRYLGMDATQASFLLLHLAPDTDATTVRDGLRARFRDVDVWTRSEFSLRSRLFWLIQTGAGAALTLAAILGFAIGLVVVSQTIYSLTAENIEEYATLKALGASNRDVHSVVLMQSLVCGVAGGAIGLMLVEPFAALARSIVTWIHVPLWMYLAVGAAVIMLCMTASWIAARPATGVDPGRVFRV